MFFHKPPYYNSLSRANEYLHTAYQPVLDRYAVDLVFNGHDHVVARTFPMYQGKSVKDGAKGTIYYIAGRSGSKIYRLNMRKDWDAFFYNPTDEPDYVVVEVGSRRLTVKSVKQDGTSVDSVSLNK